MVIKKIVTEHIHLYDGDNQYIGEYPILNDDLTTVIIFTNVTGGWKLLGFLRSTGEIQKKYNIPGLYVTEEKFNESEYDQIL